MLPHWIAAILLGLLGGGLRVVIGGRIVRPQPGIDENNRRVYYLGSASTIFAGGAAGYFAWALTTTDVFAGEGFGGKAMLATVLAGVAGTEIVWNYVSRVLGVTPDQQANQQANQETSDIVKPMAESQKTLVQDLSDCQERERQLRKELERLKKSGTPDS